MLRTSPPGVSPLLLWLMDQFPLSTLTRLGGCLTWPPLVSSLIVLSALCCLAARRCGAASHQRCVLECLSLALLHIGTLPIASAALWRFGVQPLTPWSQLVPWESFVGLISLYSLSVLGAAGLVLLWLLGELAGAPAHQGRNTR